MEIIKGSCHDCKYADWFWKDAMNEANFAQCTWTPSPAPAWFSTGGSPSIYADVEDGILFTGCPCWEPKEGGN